MRTCGSNGEWSSTTAPVCQSKKWPNVHVECVPVPIVICSDLSSPTNGDIDYGGAGSTNRRSVNTVATYTCDTRYTLTGGSTTRTCESDGVWSGSAPMCQSKVNELCTLCLLSVFSYTADCPDLPSLINGMIMYNTGSPDNRPINAGAIYTCNTGYTLTGGDTTRTCVSGGIWSGVPPTCQSELNSCTVCVCEYNKLLLFRLSEVRPPRYILAIWFHGLLACTKLALKCGHSLFRISQKIYTLLFSV